MGHLHQHTTAACTQLVSRAACYSLQVLARHHPGLLQGSLVTAEQQAQRMLTWYQASSRGHQTEMEAPTARSASTATCAPVCPVHQMNGCDPDCTCSLLLSAGVLSPIQAANTAACGAKTCVIIMSVRIRTRGIWLSLISGSDDCHDDHTRLGTACCCVCSLDG